MIKRRVIGIAAVAAVAVVLTAGSVILFPVAALADLLRGRPRLPLVRLMAFGACWAWLELTGVALAGILWIAGRAGDAQANRRLQTWWADRLMTALRTTCDLDPEVEGIDALRPGPVILLGRHASLADSLLTAWAITNGAAMAPRVVMKKELLADPCLDIVGNRLPNCFVDRSAADSAVELSAIARMGAGLGEDDVAVIFPEGTRSNPDKRRRQLERIATSDPDRAEKLGRLEHLLPPRRAGTRALFEAAPEAEVVFCWHVGFEGLDTFSGILAALGGPRRRVRIGFRRVPRAEVPAGAGFTDWLDTQWLALDTEVSAATDSDSRGSGE